MKAGKLHPIVAAFINSSKLITETLRGNDDGSELVAAALEISSPRQDRTPEQLAEGLRRAAAVDLSKQDPCLAVIYLHLWAASARAAGRRDEVAAIANLARSLVSPDMPAEVRAEALGVECRLAETNGDWTRSTELHKSITEMLPWGSPRYVRSLSPWLMTLALTWRLDEHQAELSELASHPDFAANALLIRLMFLVETGRLEEAGAVHAELAPRCPLVGLEALWNIYHGAHELMTRPPAPEEIVPANRGAITTALLLRRPDRALEVARAQAAGHFEIFLSYPEYFAFDLIRAELAAGNGEAARRLLAMRRERNNVHPLDDLFLARAEALAGDWETAARHYAAATEAARRLRAEGRLEFELRMALELAPGDLLRLMRMAAASGAAPAAARTAGESGPALRPRGPGQLAGSSAQLGELRATIAKLSALDAPVLITGETGAGKELVARALHDESPRSSGPFVAVNCGAIADSLLESELFGHERGAFTGAHAARAGIFESAGRGTVLLDEIGDISPRLQAALLRVLETGEIRPVGASRSRRIGCRVLAATNAELERRVEAGAFRRDLLFRLNRLEVRVPPLRERRDDILPLAGHFLCEGRADGRQPEMSEALRQELLSRQWPGNVRELRNVIERMRLLNSDKLAYDLADLDASAGPDGVAPAAQPVPDRTAEGAPAGERARHPIVSAYMETDASFSVILAGAEKLKDPVVDAMIAMHRAMTGKLDYGRALQMAVAANLAGCDPDLAIMFLCIWAHVSQQGGRTAEAEALVARAAEAVGERTPGELSALVVEAEANLARGCGDMVAVARLEAEWHRRVPPDSPRREVQMLTHAAVLANRGLAGNMEEELKRLQREGTEHIRSRAVMAHFLVCCESCRPEEALALAREIAHYPNIQEIYADSLRGREVLLRVMQGVPVSGLEATPPAAAVTGWLLARRPKDALRAARSWAAESPEKAVAFQSFTDFNLVRAELAAGNGEAARRLMLRRRELRNVHPYMDDFFLARVELLDGNRKPAGRCFAASWAAAERLRAISRLEFELRLACELSPADASRLVLEAERLAASGPVPPAAEASAATTAAAPRGLERLLGRSRAMVAVRAQVRRLAGLDVPVLITGPTGVGKEMVARAIHECSSHANEPFLAVNCGAISESLLESELFGHEAGAFTGASRARRGFFEEAGRGVLLLDEIGEISPRLQIALLRVLEAVEIRPAGSSAARPIYCRVLAATNADLERLVAEGRFRQDLLFRLKRLEIRVPPLSERREDILVLAGHFLAEGRSGGRKPALSEALRRRLMAEAWPGNVRELRNAVERMRLMNSDKLAYDLADYQGDQDGCDADGHDGRAASTTSGIGSKDQAIKPVGQDEPAGTAASAAPETATTPAAGNDADGFATFVLARRSPLRRLERIRGLFTAHRRLTRMELAEYLKVSGETVTRDLRALVAEGFIVKIEPNDSPRTHYFALREDRG